MSLLPLFRLICGIFPLPHLNSTLILIGCTPSSRLPYPLLYSFPLYAFKYLLRDSVLKFTYSAQKRSKTPSAGRVYPFYFHHTVLLQCNFYYRPSCLYPNDFMTGSVCGTPTSENGIT